MADALPLHAPNVPPMNLELIADSNEDVRLAKRWLQDPTLYAHLTRNVPREQRQPFDCRLHQRDIDTMVGAGIVRRTRADESVRSWCKVFAIPEWHKERRRLLCEPRLLNQLWRQQGLPDVSLPTVLDAQRMASEAAHNGESIHGADAKAWYFQLLLSEQVQRYFGFQHGGVTYAFTRLVMGGAISVFVGQVIMSAAFCIPRALIYIDNVFWPTTDHADAASTASAIAELMGITLSDNAPQTTILGMEFDLERRTVTVSRKFRDTHAPTLREFCSDINGGRDISFRRLWTNLGIALRVLVVGRLALGFIAPVLRFIGRAARVVMLHGQWGATAPKPNDAERSALIATINFVLRVNSVALPRVGDEDVDTIAFSDASDLGAGAVVIEGASINTYYWTTAQTMRVHEVECAVWAVGVNERSECEEESGGTPEASPARGHVENMRGMSTTDTAAKAARPGFPAERVINDVDPRCQRSSGHDHEQAVILRTTQLSQRESGLLRVAAVDLCNARGPSAIKSDHDNALDPTAAYRDSEGARYQVDDEWDEATISINVREALAAQAALAQISIDNKKILLVIDNTTVVAALNNGRCRNTAINEVVCNIVAQRRRLFVTWVPSATNVADGPSRGREADLQQLQQQQPPWSRVLQLQHTSPGEHQRR